MASEPGISRARPAIRRTKSKAVCTNRATKSGISAAFNVPTTLQPPTPISTSATYNLDLPLSNSAAVNSSVVTSLTRKAESELKFIDTKATTEIGSLPGGSIGLALGAEYREEELQDTPDPLSLSGEILGQGNTQTSASRDNFAAYAEFALPLTRQIEAQVALRYDNYSDFGNTTNPKLGLKFKPTPEVLLRANWGRGFRAPSLVEITPSRGLFFVQVNDPVNNLTDQQVSGVFTGNPDLRPEKSRSTTLGIVWEPTNAFNVSFDVYDISYSDIVNAPSFQAIVNNNNPAQVIRLPPTPQFPGGQIVTVLNGFVNVNRTETRGFDIDARYIARTNYGTWTTRLNATYVGKFEEDGVDKPVATAARLPSRVGRVSCRSIGTRDLGPRRGGSTTSATTIRTSSRRRSSRRRTRASRTARTRTRCRRTRPSTYSAATTSRPICRCRRRCSTSSMKRRRTIPDLSATNLYDFTQYDVRGRIFRIGANYKFR